MGLFLLWNAVGTLAISELYEAAKACPRKGTIWAASICILFGFGAKAGMFPLHIWLPKAHPVAPAPASALLSGILTKSGIFGVIVVCGEHLPREHGVGQHAPRCSVLITMLGGAVLAVFSINLKRTLACSSMSQIGFITDGLSRWAACWARRTRWRRAAALLLHGQPFALQADAVHGGGRGAT